MVVVLTTVYWQARRDNGGLHESMNNFKTVNRDAFVKAAQRDKTAPKAVRARCLLRSRQVRLIDAASYRVEERLALGVHGEKTIRVCRKAAPHTV
jgi:hypothetical protein